MRTKITTIACLAGIAAIGASAAPAQATFGYKAATFKVEVEGVQTNAWKTNHVNQGGCDADMNGEGTEVVRFHSTPKLVKAYSFTGSKPMFLNSGKKFDKYIDLISKITRRGTMTVSGGKVCSYGDGTGGEKPQPDCGTKHSKWYAELNYSSNKRDFLMLEQALVVPLGPFRHCPSGNGAWPSMLDRTNKGEVGRRLPQRDLFGSNRLHIIRAAGREEATSGDHWHQTTIQYTIKLTRVGKVQSS
jgi:hypothetical protein